MAKDLMAELMGLAVEPKTREKKAPPTFEDMIVELEREHPNVKNSMIKALGNVATRHQARAERWSPKRTERMAGLSLSCLA